MSIEIRPVKADEADAFLRLLCEVFGLDYARAHRIFFSEPMFDLQRKWALFDSGVIVSILTTVPLEFGWGRAIGIAGVATLESRRGEGLANKLLSRVLSESEKVGEKGALLFARQPELYGRVGFSVLDEVVRGPVQAPREEATPDVLEYEEVVARYETWACSSPHHLRRDQRRWNYWKWNFRMCTAFGDGYMCSEGGSLRECCFTPPVEWRVPVQTEWVGLKGLAEHLQVPLGRAEHDLYFMGRGIPTPPRMFMTDQF